MQLADACWRDTVEGGTADADTWSAALDEVRYGTAQGIERLYSGFERSERSVLRAVARSGSIYGIGAGLLDLSAGAATHARQTFLDSGDLVDHDVQFAVVDPVLVDPVLADWLRHRFPI